MRGWCRACWEKHAANIKALQTWEQSASWEHVLPDARRQDAAADAEPMQLAAGRQG